MLEKIANVIATFFGAGLAPKAPGTMGSLASLPLAFVLVYFGGRSALFVGIVVVFAVGVYSVKLATKNSVETDPGRIVIDETAGQLTTFLLVAPELKENISFQALLLYVLGFGLFRLFDILKFGPVKWADTKLKNAIGVMLDDVFAGVFAAIVLMVLAR